MSQKLCVSRERRQRHRTHQEQGRDADVHVAWEVQYDYVANEETAHDNQAGPDALLTLSALDEGAEERHRGRCDLLRRFVSWYLKLDMILGHLGQLFNEGCHACVYVGVKASEKKRVEEGWGKVYLGRGREDRKKGKA